ncbi:MAG: PH domain-containing protein [Candidatus Thiodiazotropha sp. (ex Monitilora ramsayi)]|nr:PH domain-containing protein [Candidatus Thiodiazotropha sp. (ex Monitilora ramsayi)]
MEFPITPSPLYTVIFAGFISLITLTIGALFIWFAFSASSLSASLSQSSLQVHLPIYGRSIPLSALDIDSAKIVDLNHSSELKPRTRSNGIGLPGFSVGWFRLHNGEKALSAITSRENVLYLKTSENYSLLLSLTEPEIFLSQLNKHYQ